MALLDRVATLIRANLNDLVSKAEHPEKLLQQLLLDMQNQYLQLKTQVAIAIAGHQSLVQKQRENLDAHAAWTRKAELAVAGNQDDLARVALDRSLTYESATHGFAAQVEEQSHQVNTLRDALHRLESKMAETEAKVDLLIAQHRRARLLQQTGAAALDELRQEATLGRVHNKIAEAAAVGEGRQIAAALTNTDRQFDQLEKSDRIDRLLADLKARLDH